MKKRAYLIIDGGFPTIHKNEKEANNYITFVRDTDKAHKKLKGMFCLFTDKDLSEGFANCIFKSI